MVISNNKKTVLLVIDNFLRGGAETMFVNLLPSLNEEFKVVIVTLNSICEFSKEDITCASRFTLSFHSYKDTPRTVLQLKKIIRVTQPDLIHAQLYWSTIIARLAAPKKIPFIFTIHNKLSLDAFAANKLSYYLEKLTYRKRHVIISVSQDALNDYNNYIKVKGKSIILNNFVHNHFFEQSYSFSNKSLKEIKIVAVGNLRFQKNYEFLLEVMKTIKNKVDIKLDIVGEGELRNSLQTIIDRDNLPVKLLGSKSNVEEILPNYHAFIMNSKYEGFGNAPVEAMAVGLPLILNDLDIMKEMSKCNALFFESENRLALNNIFLNFFNYRQELLRMSELGKKIARENYSSEIYFTRLKDIYYSFIT